MPTDRVHRLPQQAQLRAIRPHRPQPSTSDAATQRRHARPAPNERRCTRYVAMHPLRRDTPDQKGCNAYGSGAPPPTTSTTADSCSPFTHSRSVSRRPCTRHCTRSVALHPFRRAAPVPSRRTRSVALHPIRRGVMPTDRVHRLPQQTQPRAILPHRPQPSASVAATRPRHAHPDSEQETLHPLRRATPVTSRCTRYVAMHPIRRGVMPTDRVHCRPRQAQPRAITPHRPQPSVSDAATHPQNARQYSSAAIKETTRDREAHARHNATHRSTH